MARLHDANCQRACPLAPSVEVYPFHEGGTLSENLGSGQNPSSGQTRSPGHGVWDTQRYNRRSFSGVFVINRYDATGAFIGTQKATAAWELSTIGNRYTSNATVEIFDANDNNRNGLRDLSRTRIEESALSGPARSLCVGPL